MAKRLHDTECWNKKWFRELPIQSKLLWLYLLDFCNTAGVVEVDDIKQISFFIGCKITEETFKPLLKQLKKIDDKRFLVLDFIEFQYGKLHEAHKMYKKVISELVKFNLKYPIDTASSILDTVKDKDMDKDKDKDMDKDKDKEGMQGEKNWRNDFSIYELECVSAFKTAFSDKEWMASRELYHPNLDIRLSLEKALNDFWATEAGWIHKKKKKIQKIDWLRTIENSLSITSNQVRKKYENKAFVR